MAHFCKKLPFALDCKNSKYKYLCKHFLFSKTSWRRLEDVFSVTIFHLPRRLQDVFARSLPKTPSRRLQDIFKTSSQDVFKKFLRPFQDVFQGVFKMSSRRICKTSSSRRLQEDVLQLCLEDVLKTKRQKNVTLKTSSRCLQYILIKTTVCWDIIYIFFQQRGFCSSYSMLFLKAPASYGKKTWNNFCTIVLLFVRAQKKCLRFLKSYFKLEILIFLSFVISVLLDLFN